MGVVKREESIQKRLHDGGIMTVELLRYAIRSMMDIE